MASIAIDGSTGEAGGQGLRTALALSGLTGKPFYIDKIRANRVEPGIRPSHLAAIEAIGKICNATFKANVGDTELEFKPDKITDEKVSVNIDTAGSIPLVLQAVMIASINSKD